MGEYNYQNSSYIIKPLTNILYPSPLYLFKCISLLVEIHLQEIAHLSSVIIIHHSIRFVKHFFQNFPFNLLYWYYYWAIGLSPMGTMVGFVCTLLTNGLSYNIFFKLTDQVLSCYIVFSYFIFLRDGYWTWTNDTPLLHRAALPTELSLLISATLILLLYGQ